MPEAQILRDNLNSDLNLWHTVKVNMLFIFIQRKTKREMKKKLWMRWNNVQNILTRAAFTAQSQLNVHGIFLDIFFFLWICVCTEKNQNEKGVIWTVPLFGKIFEILNQNFFFIWTICCHRYHIFVFPIVLWISALPLKWSKWFSRMEYCKFCEFYFNQNFGTTIFYYTSKLIEEREIVCY